MSQSNFNCTECGNEHMTFLDGKTFLCEKCGYTWQLTELGEKLLRSIELK